MSADRIQSRAIVTGATRGIGKATALALALAGWDVAITGRTQRAGEGHDDSDTGGGRALPGSLEETARTIRESGRTSLELVADLHDHPALRGGVDRVIAEWGGVDLLVNNAVDTGPGSMVGIQEVTVDQMESKLAANVVAQLVLVQAVLPGMLEQGGGMVVDVTSHVATADPPGPVGQGGWGLAYAASKAAFHRIAPLLAVEFGERGIRAYNLDPGYVETERQKVNAEALGLVGHYIGAPPSVPAAAIVWLAAHPDQVENGQTVRAQKLALTHHLHPDWRPDAE
ncbi:MAG TPA: SDR family oxidoreductase [Acidimicrobiales bacterium]|jgi:NAD(P)-dependent dehydrogenase (short-subunit alcohol dehydrogenase family)